MGIDSNLAQAVFIENSRKKFNGQIITLGVQDIFLNQPVFESIAREHGISLSHPISFSRKRSLARDGYISDICFFKNLGFEKVLRLDATNYEGADVVFDLNLPIENNINNTQHLNNVIGMCDVVFNGGTIEHVFNIPVALENIFKMLKVGGRVIHTAPSSNHIDHGFYMLSPTFFYDYYRANSFEINELKLVKYWTEKSRGWEMLDYQPGILDGLSMGGADDAMYLIYVVCTKCLNSTFNVVPQQGMYSRNLWTNDFKDEVRLDVIENSGDSFQSRRDVNNFFKPSSADNAIQIMNEILSQESKIEKDKYKAALEVITDAIDSNPDITLLYSHCVQLSMAILDFNSALRYASIVAALLPDDEAAQSQLQNVKDKIKNISSSI